MGTCTRLRREITMVIAAIYIILTTATVAGIWYIWSMIMDAIRDENVNRFKQGRVIMEFQDILNERLEEHNPRIQVWLANKDTRCRPHARIAAHGHVFFTRAGSTEEMRAKADGAANFFAKKQLMKWIPH